MASGMVQSTSQVFRRTKQPGGTLRGSGFTYERIVAETDTSRRKTKIICTIGPSCWDEKTLVELIDNGMGVARLNFSHGDHKGHGEVLQRIRAAAAKRPNSHIAIMLDTKGPEIRTGFYKEGTDKVSYKKGDIIEISSDYKAKQNKNKIVCSYPTLATTVKVGSGILIADGSLVVTVTEVHPEKSLVKARVENNATLGERKNMNLPGAIVDLPTLTEQDIRDVQDFGCAHHVDLIAASFCRKAADIHTLREVLAKAGGEGIGIIAKIENQEGMQNYDEILEATDGIMVARGDLGMEIAPEKVFLAQKYMIRRANIVGKPVVTATQMLESMIVNPRPTRAECADVANAVLDGTDCVMLSGETAGGEHPIAAVTIMGKICVEAENTLSYQGIHQATRTSTMLEQGTLLSALESAAAATVTIALDINAACIVLLSENGKSARMIGKYRPSMPVLTVTAKGRTARICNGVIRGITARTIDEVGLVRDADSLINYGIQQCFEEGYCADGDNVVVFHSKNRAMKVVQVSRELHAGKMQAVIKTA